MSRPTNRFRRAGSVLALAGLLSVAAPGFGEEGRQPSRGGYLTVTYLGNEGVWIEAPSGEIVIDGLFGEGLTGYETVPPRERKKLERAAPPYDDLDLILATHHHGDHFDAAAVSRHLRANPEAIFVSTEQAAAALAELAQPPAGSRRQVHAVGPEPGEEVVVPLPFATLRALYITHGAFRPPITNLGFILEIDGLKILHLGDSEATLEDLQAYSLARERIDIAFVPFWYLLDDDGRTAVSEGIAARTVIPLHVPAEDAPASYFGGPGGQAELLRSMENAVPGVTAFQKPLRTRRFAAPGSTPDP